jgi:anti-sigma regulatory factor (Ser/Thr protein kinase)
MPGEMIDGLRSSAALEGCAFESVRGGAEAVARLRRRSYDVVITSPESTLEEDLDLFEEMREVRPGVKTILLASHATPEDVIASLRARAFAVFAPPHDVAEVAHMARRAIDERDWRDGIEVVSAHRDWLSLRVQCRLQTADRLVRFLHELRPDVADQDKDEALVAFREILLNAMEHGAKFDPEKVVEVSAIRTERTLVFYVRDPGPGFKQEDLRHAAVTNPPDDPLAHFEERLEQGRRPGGFGILVARNVVDELLYSERGNEVVLIKHLG